MYRGIGTTFTISTPLGKQSIDIPLDAMAYSAINAIWPPLQSRIEAEIPVAINTAWPLLQKKLEAEIPVLIKQAVPAVQTEEQAVLKQVNRTAFYLGAALLGGIGVAVMILR